MDDGAPSLEVGFAIDTGGSFEALTQLAELMDSTEAKILREAKSIEQATSGMLNLGGASASMTAFGSASTKAGADAARAYAQAEKAGESLSRQLDRQTATFGLTREQIRAMKVDSAALAAEQQGLTELAGRLRAQQQALADAEAAAAAQAQRDAEATKQAADAYRQFNAVAAQKMADYKAQSDAADQLRARIDPLSVAQKRYDDEVRTAKTLLDAKRISEAEHAAAVALSEKDLAAAKKTLEGHTSALGLNRIQTMEAQSAVIRFSDAVMAGRNPLQAFAVEAHKGVEVLSSDDDGMAGGLAKVKALLSPTNLALAALTAVTIAAVGAWYSYDAAMNKLAVTAQGTGALLGSSAEQLEANAVAATNASTLTIGAARNLVAAYASVARSDTVDAGLAAITKDFAAATGQDMKAAQQNLVELFSDTGKGAEELAAKYGFLTAAQVEEIEKLQEEGKFEQAQIQLKKDLSRAIDGAAEHVTGLALAWERVKQGASDAYEAAGAYMSKYGAGFVGALPGGAAMSGLFTPLPKQPAAPGNGNARANATAQQALALANQDTGYATQKEHLAQLATVNAALANTTGMAADQVSRLRYEQDALTHATTTWVPKAQQANDIIAANTKLRQATTPQARAAARALQEQAKAEGQVVTAQEVSARVQDRLEGYHNRANTAGQKHAEALQREAQAVTAQIADLGALATAYGQSGGAALIAEARVKAESKAIKERGDIEAAVSREIQLVIAQRVADAEKTAAATRDQARIETEVNGAVAAGTIPAAQAKEIMQQRIAELPLLHALEAAQQLGLKSSVQAATKALEDQRSAAADAHAAAVGASFVADDAAADRRLAQLQLERQLVGATDEVRVHSLAVLQATNEAIDKGYKGQQLTDHVTKQVAIADGQQALTRAQNDYNQSLSRSAELLSLINDHAQTVAGALSDAFGNVGGGIGKAMTALTGYAAAQAKIDEDHRAAVRAAGTGPDSYAAIAQADAVAAQKSATARTAATEQAIDGIKNLFSTHSAAYKGMQAIEEVYAAFQAAETIASIARDLLKTTSSVANAGVRTTANTAEGASKIFAELGPWAFPVVAAMVALIASLGFSGSGGGAAAAPTSAADLQKQAGTGTVLGSPNAQSASIKNSLDLVAKNTSGVLQYSNQMLVSLKSIDASIGALTSTVAKQLNVSGAIGDTTKLNLGSSGSAGFLGLFSSSTTRTLYDAGITLAATTVGNIVANGISGQTYQIVEQVKKSSGFLGIGGGTKTTYQTTNGALPSDIAASIQSVIGALENGIVTAAGAIGVNGAKAMLDNFNVSIGQLSFNGLDAQGIEDELNAVFSSVGDQMVTAILPDIAKFQKAGEGLFETLERVASTVVAVDDEFKKLGRTTGSIDVDMGVASQFDSVSDFTSAADAYFAKFYTTAEQTAAQAADMQQVFASLNLTMPDSLTGFRQLVDAQDLTTTAGQQTYATLLKVAPAFADLEQALTGAKSAADVLSERQDLQNQLWQLLGDTADIRAAQLATLDVSNRALQEQVWATQDAQDLASAWSSVGDSIEQEIERIRGINTDTGASFAQLQGQFNAATTAARSGDQDAAKSLPQLSQALLTAAQTAATSSQELNRVQAATAASLVQTKSVIDAITGAGTAAGTAPSTTNAALLAAAANTQAASTPAAANDDLASQIQALRDELAGMRADNNAGHAATAGNTGRMAKTLDNVTAQSGGDAISTVQQAA